MASTIVTVIVTVATTALLRAVVQKRVLSIASVKFDHSTSLGRNAGSGSSSSLCGLSAVISR